MRDFTTTEKVVWSMIRFWPSSYKKCRYDHEDGCHCASSVMVEPLLHICQECEAIVCDPSCLTCDGENSNDCVTCREGLTPKETWMGLSLGPWGGTSCGKCHASCSTCDGPTSSDCTTASPTPSPTSSPTAPPILAPTTIVLATVGAVGCLIAFFLAVRGYYKNGQKVAAIDAETAARLDGK